MIVTTDDYVFGFTATTGWTLQPWELPAKLPELIRQMIPRLGQDFIIEDEIAIHVTAVVEKGAIIKSPAIIGSHCFVAAHAYLRGGVYAINNVSIGAGCEIKSSIIFPNSSIAHFNFIGDSIVGANVNIEAGAITANHHNDRDDKTISVLIDGELQKTTATKFGALISDGTKIGANAVLSPGTILPQHSIVKRLELINQEEQPKLQKGVSMNKNIAKLHAIALKPSRLIIGLMSGTSVDGLDVALCRFTGTGVQTAMELIAFETIPYGAGYKAEIQAVFSKRQVDLEKVCILNEWVAFEHARLILQCLKKWSIDADTIDAIASHGQTIYHAPQSHHANPLYPNATLQIGDGDHLAVKTGIITLSDFRQKHIAAGGEGAPLAVYGDYLLFAKPGENRIMLNIGGIANFTWLPGVATDSPIFSTDTGPGNTMMDAYIRKYFPGKDYDDNAAIASTGVVDELLLAALKENPFFSKAFPKTTGPELFNLNYLGEAAQHAGVVLGEHSNVMATLNRFSADMIAGAIKQIADNEKNITVYTSGGGMHNRLLMKNLHEKLPGFTFKTTDDLFVNPDAKEAVLFAILANESIAGGEIKIPGNPFVSMGKISFPH